MTVSIRSTRPSLRYCLIRECLEKVLRVTSVPRVMTLVLNSGCELAGGGGADLPVEDDLQGVGAAEVEVVGHQRLDETAGVAGSVEPGGQFGKAQPGLAGRQDPVATSQ
jgi:hypothetical protein